MIMKALVKWILAPAMLLTALAFAVPERAEAHWWRYRAYYPTYGVAYGPRYAYYPRSYWVAAPRVYAYRPVGVVPAPVYCAPAPCYRPCW
jgi:hypothetical protein